MTFRISLICETGEWWLSLRRLLLTFVGQSDK